MKWESERQLCDAFREWCAGRYMVHPECHGWDMVLVDNDDRRLGVQAKLGDGATVVSQCVEKLEEGNADCAAILMPFVPGPIRRLCRASRLGLIEPVIEGGTHHWFRVAMPTAKQVDSLTKRGRKPLPLTPSSLPAGVPSPRSIKDGEYMLEVIMHSRGGYLTNKDFQRVGWPERFHPKWLYKLKGRPRWEPTLTAVLPSQLDPKAFKAMKASMEAKGVAKCT